MNIMEKANDFNNHITFKSSESGYGNKYYNLLLNQKFVDTELVLAGNKKIRIHGCILAAESTKFLQMIETNNRTEYSLDMTEYTEELMKYVLEYIYQGSVIIPRRLENDLLLFIKNFKLPSGCIIDDETYPNESLLEQSIKDDSNTTIETTHETSKDFLYSSDNEIEKTHRTSKECDSSETDMETTHETSRDFLYSFDNEIEKTRETSKDSDSSETDIDQLPNQTQTSKKRHNSESDEDVIGRRDKSTRFKNPFAKIRKIVRKSLSPSNQSTPKQIKAESKEKAGCSSKEGWVSKGMEVILGDTFCVVCDRNYANIRRHIKEKHRENSRVRCHRCNECQKRYYLKEFAVMHHTICDS